MARRILIALCIFLLSFSVCFFIRQNYGDKGAGDFYFPICGSMWLLKSDPRLEVFSSLYEACAIPQQGVYLPLNPITTVLTALPFSFLGTYIGGPALFATLSALAAYGALQKDEYWRLLFLASPVYFSALWFVQWAPAMLAVAYLPSAWMFLALAKPQLGLPVFLSRFLALNRSAWIAALSCIIFLGLSLVIYPTWPIDWLNEGSLGSYSAFIPILTIPGFLLLGWLYFWKQEHTRLLSFMACVPQKSYDPLALWAIPQTRTHMLIFTAGSWLPFAAYQQQIIGIEIYLLSLYFLLSGLLLTDKIQLFKKEAPSPVG